MQLLLKLRFERHSDISDHSQWHLVCLVVVILEARRVHSIIYLRFYYIFHQLLQSVSIWLNQSILI